MKVQAPSPCRLIAYLDGCKICRVQPSNMRTCFALIDNLFLAAETEKNDCPYRLFLHRKKRLVSIVIAEREKKKGRWGKEEKRSKYWGLNLFVNKVAIAKTTVTQHMLSQCQHSYTCRVVSTQKEIISNRMTLV